MEDIVLVTGCHRTRSSTNTVFNEGQVNAQISLGVQVPGIVGSTVNRQGSNQYARGTMANHGPGGGVCGPEIAITDADRHLELTCESMYIHTRVSCRTYFPRIGVDT